MEIEARNQFIAACLNEGKSLSDVQKLLVEKGVNLTYFDLRLLAADLTVNWTKLDPKVSDHPKPAPGPAENVLDAAPAGAGGGAGKTEVTVSRLVRPGSAMSGDVTFASGAKAEWFLDQSGRLGLNPAKGSSKPTEDDLVAFQEELQAKLGGG